MIKSINWKTETYNFVKRHYLIENKKDETIIIRNFGFLKQDLEIVSKKVEKGQ